MSQALLLEDHIISDALATPDGPCSGMPRPRTWSDRSFGAMEAGSQRGSILALASTAFGCAMLSLPWVFAVLGAILGTSFLLAAAAANFLSMRLLANAAYMTGKKNYADCVRSAVGPYAAWTLDIVVFLYIVGCICSNMVFLEEFGTLLVDPLHLPDVLHSETNFMLALACVPLLPFSLTRTLSRLRYVMLTSLAGLLLVVGAIVVGTPAKLAELMQADRDGFVALPSYWWLMPQFSSWREVPQTIAMLFFAFCCHVSLFSTYGELTMPTPRRVDKVLSRAVVVQGVIYFLIGFCGMLSFGPPCPPDSVTTNWCTPTNILASSRLTGVSGTGARIAMAFAILVAIPLNTHAGRAILQRMFLGTDHTHVGSSFVSVGVHIFLTVLLLGTALFIAVSYKSVTNIISIVGGGGAATFMFTVPLIMTLLLRGRSAIQVGRNSPQIGEFLGVTKQGARMAALLLAPCVTLGYASAILAVDNMIT